MAAEQQFVGKPPMQQQQKISGEAAKISPAGGSGGECGLQ
jgi:hypothetical protein